MTAPNLDTEQPLDLAALRAPVDSESPDAPHNPDVFELRHRLERTCVALEQVLAACDEASAKSPDAFRAGQDHLPPAFREINYHGAFMWLAGIVNRIEAAAKGGGS